MNIFEISKELESVFDELEENAGELTEELEEKLSISQDEFRSKVNAYLSIIKHIESDIDCCDKEIKRLQSVKKSKQNTIDRLKNILVWAIDKFGDSNKSGNKYVDLGTSKVTVKSSNKVIVNEKYADDIISSTFAELNEANYTKELYDNPIKDLITTPENKLDGITTTISVDIPLEDLYNDKGDNFIKSLFNYDANFKVKTNISKSSLKDNIIKDSESYKDLAYIENTKSLLIK